MMTVPANRSIMPLGDYCSALTIDRLPSDLIDLAKFKILDSLACAFLGSDSDQSRVALGLTRRLPKGPCAIFKPGTGLQMADAAFVNSVLVHSILQDDVDLTIGHPACNIIPSALAVGSETVTCSGADTIAAIVAGYEAMWRVGGRGTFMVPTIARGFRGNTIVGVFGAAAASARAMGLDPRGMTNAISAAASFAAGLLRPLNVGTMERSFQQAANTQHGVMAALLAAEGLDACDLVLTGEGGFYSCFMGVDAFPEDALDGLGTEFHMSETYAKPFPSAGSNTVGIAVLAKLLASCKLNGEIAKMTVEVVPRFTGKPGYPAISHPGPFATLEHALISFPFGLACLAELGDVTLPVLRKGLHNERVSRLADIIELRGVEVPYPLWCRITVVDSSGQTHVATSEEIDWAQFYLDHPTAVAKFRAAAATVMDGERTEQIVDIVLDLDNQPSLAALNACLIAAAA